MAAEGNVDRLILDTFFAESAIRRRTICEVGAARPDYLSVSEEFRKAGWRVVAIEPNPDFAAEYRKRGFEIYECAAGPKDEDDVPFAVADLCGAPYEGGKITFESFSSLGLAGQFEAAFEEWRERSELRTIRVKVRRLDTILREAVPIVDAIDVLSVDVEGWEMQVLEGFAIDHWRPRVVLLENLFNSPRYRRYMDSLNYSLYGCFPPNDLYARQ